LISRSRRQLVLAGLSGMALGTLPVRRAGAASPAFETLTLEFGGRRRGATVWIPRHGSPVRFPTLVLLHGRGETASVALGVRAWADRYGLVDAYQRLVGGPDTLGAPTEFFTAQYRNTLAEELEHSPFRGQVIVCPYTINPHQSANRAQALDDYARFIDEELLPRVEEQAPVRPGMEHTAIDGCSLGGYVATEVFLRRPERFGSLGVVQSAIGEFRVPGYAVGLAEAGHRGRKCRIWVRRRRSWVRADMEVAWP
jgi:pimeloyl-ACP methyl ester carboxylesterase